MATCLPEGFVTIEYLATALNTSRETIDRYIARGIITKRVRFGMRYYYNVERVRQEITKFIEKGIK